MPNPNILLHDLDEEKKKHALSHNGEHFAIAFGLISTSHGWLFFTFVLTSIHLVKDGLYACGDHSYGYYS